MFPLKANDPYIKETGERSTLGKVVGGGSDTPELPDYSVADAGKVLTVGDDGSLEWDEKGAGGGDAFALLDFTKYGTVSINGVYYSSAGATFDNASDYISLPRGRANNITLYIDAGSFVVDPSQGTHKRFIMASTNSGLIWNHSEGKWGVYNGSSWELTEDSNPSAFNNAKIKLYIDDNWKWHIYINDVLWFETTTSTSSTEGYTIGSSGGQSINTGTFKGARIYSGNYTE